MGRRGGRRQVGETGSLEDGDEPIDSGGEKGGEGRGMGGRQPAGQGGGRGLGDGSETTAAIARLGCTKCDRTSSAINQEPKERGGESRERRRKRKEFLDGDGANHPVPRLGKEAAAKAVKEWSQPKSQITHVFFCTTSGVDMPGANYQLAKLLGLRPSVNRLVSCFAGGGEDFNSVS